MMTKSIHLALIFALLGPTAGRSQSLPIGLPAPGTPVSLTSAYRPLMLQGVKVNPNDPFQFEFIVSDGEDDLRGDALKEAAQPLIEYFFASLTVPVKDLWVNLSPYEHNRVIMPGLSKTAMGHGLLAQDYLLKQISATLLDPQGDVGKRFWAAVDKKAQSAGVKGIVPAGLLHKVWIVADRAEIFVQNHTAVVTDVHWSVLLEKDLNAPQHTSSRAISALARNDGEEDAMRRIVLPELEKEVNYGRHFAPLRQITQALMLAAWYKNRFKSSILAKQYADKNEVRGIALDQGAFAGEVFRAYQKAYKKGVVNRVEELRSPDGKPIARRYFAGGWEPAAAADPAQTHDPRQLKGVKKFNLSTVEVRAVADGAMAVPQVRDFFPALDDLIEKEDKLSWIKATPLEDLEKLEWLLIENIVHNRIVWYRKYGELLKYVREELRKRKVGASQWTFQPALTPIDQMIDRAQEKFEWMEEGDVRDELRNIFGSSRPPVTKDMVKKIRGLFKVGFPTDASIELGLTVLHFLADIEDVSAEDKTAAKTFEQKLYEMNYSSLRSLYEQHVERLFRAVIVPKEELDDVRLIKKALYAKHIDGLYRDYRLPGGSLKDIAARMKENHPWIENSWVQEMIENEFSAELTVTDYFLERLTEEAFFRTVLVPGYIGLSSALNVIMLLYDGALVNQPPSDENIMASGFERELMGLINNYRGQEFVRILKNAQMDDLERWIVQISSTFSFVPGGKGQNNQLIIGAYKYLKTRVMNIRKAHGAQSQLTPDGSMSDIVGLFKKNFPWIQKIEVQDALRKHVEGERSINTAIMSLLRKLGIQGPDGDLIQIVNYTRLMYEKSLVYEKVDKAMTVETPGGIDLAEGLREMKVKGGRSEFSFGSSASGMKSPGPVQSLTPRIIRITPLPGLQSLLER